MPGRRWAAGRTPELAEDQSGHRRAAEQARTAGADAVGRAGRRVRAAPASSRSARAVAGRGGRPRPTPGPRRRVARHRRAAGRGRAAAGPNCGRPPSRQQVADALAGHLAANRFEKWLLDEALHQLVAGASAILAELSGGAYSLTVDARSGGFGVVDHTNAVPGPARPGRCRAARRSWPRWPWRWPWPTRSPAWRWRGGPAGVAVPRRGLRHPRPRHARHGGRGPRRAGRPGTHGRGRHPRARAGRAPAGALRGPQGRRRPPPSSGWRPDVRLAVEPGGGPT